MAMWQHATLSCCSPPSPHHHQVHHDISLRSLAPHHHHRHPPPTMVCRQYTNAMFVEVAAASLLPYIYMSIHTSDKRFFVADAAAG